MLNPHCLLCLVLPPFYLTNGFLIEILHLVEMFSVLKQGNNAVVSFLSSGYTHIGQLPAISQNCISHMLVSKHPAEMLFFLVS